MGQITDNAIAWVQVRNAGGPRSATWVAAAYGAAVIAIATVFVLVNERRSGSLDGMPNVLLGFQAFIAGGITIFRILNAIERDMRAKLMESHRLMPVDPRLAVLGYAAGGGLPVLPIMLVNFMLGGVAASQAGLPMSWWIWANGVLLSWCVFAWCVAAGGGMMGIGMGVLILAPMISTFMTVGAPTMVVPGLAPMVSPLAGKTIFSVQSIGSDEMVRWVISMVLQLPVAWVIVLAGARRFRLGDVTGLTGLLGSVLVLALALSCIAAVLDPEMVPRHLHRDLSRFDDVSTIGTVISLMVLGSLTAMWHVSRHAAEFQGKYRGRSLWLRDAGIVLAVVVAAAAFLLAVPHAPADWRIRTMWTVIELVIVVMSELIWARWAIRRALPVTVSLAVMGAWWVLPLVAGAMLDVRQTQESANSAAVMQISPMAMIPEIWRNRSDLGMRVPSLAMQSLVPMLGAILLLKAKQRAEQQTSSLTTVC